LWKSSPQKSGQQGYRHGCWIPAFILQLQIVELNSKIGKLKKTSAELLANYEKFLQSKFR
jgi:hypothetical protein